MSPKKYILNESLGYLSGRFARLSLKRVLELFRLDGLLITSEEYIILVQLWSKDGIVQQAIADLIQKDKSSTARLIRDLEKQELLYRVVSDKDGREKFVFLTEKGKAAMEQATDCVCQVLDASYLGLDLNELEICKKVLRRAYKNLE